MKGLDWGFRKQGIGCWELVRFADWSVGFIWCGRDLAVGILLDFEGERGHVCVPSDTRFLRAFQVSCCYVDTEELHEYRRTRKPRKQRTSEHAGKHICEHARKTPANTRKEHATWGVQGTKTREQMLAKGSRHDKRRRR